MLDTYNLSEPAASYYYSSQSLETLQLSINESDHQPSYLNTPMLLHGYEDDLLPLYTDEFDDEILQLSGFRSRLDTPSSQYRVEELPPSFSTFMCIHRFA